MSKQLAVKTTQISLQSDPTDIIKDELVQLHRICCKLEGAWGAAESIDDVCKLSLTTLKVLDHRRRTLGIDTAPGAKRYMSPYDL